MNYSNFSYFAHSKHIYNTDRERLECDTLIKLGFNVLCPNKDLSLGSDMNAYLRIVKRCKRLIATEYSTFIGKGVYLEIKWAMMHDIPAYVLREGSLYRIISVKVYNDADWQTTFGQIDQVELISKDVLTHAPII